MNATYRDGEIDNLEQQRALISSKLNELEKQHIIETRAEEKFRLEQLIKTDQAAREEIDRKLEMLRNKCAEPKQSSPAKPGTRFGVPNLPPNYLERDDDLKEVRAALFAKETRRQHVGVLGMGGLGKSVLAAALARDKDVRAAFPDGIFWLTFGQRPDEARLLELQAGILRHIPPGQQPEALDHGATLLSLALEDRRCLLIADDLWDSRHLRHFPLGGDGSRFLLTTRDAEVIRKIGAHRCQIGLLSDPQARKLLAECSGYDENALPDEAAVIVQECGHLPLAIAAVGSMVMDESADFWQIVLKRLQTARLDKIPANVTIDYDYEDLFKVFHISVDALPQEVQAYYKTLLVFPEDAQIPQSVLQLYWKHNCLGDYEPLEIISILVKRSLFTKVNDEFFTLHDLLRDYLVFQSGGDVASLHKQLLETYKSKHPNEWHDDLFVLNDLIKDYLIFKSGCDMANLHKQLLEAYKAEYPGGWHTISTKDNFYFQKNWWNHAVKARIEVSFVEEIISDLMTNNSLDHVPAFISVLRYYDEFLCSDYSEFLFRKLNFDGNTNEYTLRMAIAKDEQTKEIQRKKKESADLLIKMRGLLDQLPAENKDLISNLFPNMRILKKNNAKG